MNRDERTDRVSRQTLPLVLVLLIVHCAVGLTGCRPRPELPGSGDDEGKTVIYRDTWGIPHIYAPSLEAGLYAMGWAQAEDRPEELLRNFLRGMGEIASVEGPDGLESDRTARVFDLYGGTRSRLSSLEPELRRHLAAFVKGINDYYSTHPSDRPAWWKRGEIDPSMVVAFSRLFLYSWSFAQGIGDLERGSVSVGGEGEPRGSNQFAIAPSRSASGEAMLLIDPHLSWWGASRFWEFRIHAGELTGSGFTLPGVPYIGLGHNEHVAWAMTTGGPDTADAYELTLNPADPSQYLFNGEWRRLTSREIQIEVAQAAEPVRFTLWESHHGPILAFQDGKAFAVRSAYADVVETTGAFFRLNAATDYRGALEATASLAFFPQNLMVADTAGNIYYQRMGRVPRRPPGFDWSRPVDGSTSATEWLGFHSVEDHLQVLNPPQGYMQNCNVPPAAMMPGSPFVGSAAAPYLISDASYGPSEGWTNQRGARAIELLAQDSSVTAEDAFRFAVDVHPYGVERWVNLLRGAYEEVGASGEMTDSYPNAFQELVEWDGNLSEESPAALKYFYWRRQLNEELGTRTSSEFRRRVDQNFLDSLSFPLEHVELNREEQVQLIRSFHRAMERIKSDYGRLDIPYGHRFRVGRDEASWPVGGGNSSQLGLETLRNLGYTSERPDHTQWGTFGQTSTQVVVLSMPIRSWTYVPAGQSDRPSSLHYRDQAERLFSKRRLKPTWWTPEELAGHTEARVILKTGDLGTE